MTRGRFGLLALAPLFLLGIAACKGAAADDGIATVGGPNGVAASQAALTDEEKLRQFAQCMRDNGVDMPDPQTDGGGRIRIDRGQLGDVDRDKAMAAMEKCRHLMPNGGARPQLSAEDQEKLRQFAQCMRDNGVPDFPDPDPNAGGIAIMGGGPGGRLNPDDPAVQKAMETCQDKLPDIRRGGPSPGGTSG
ncbi:MAG TPA: hypothetical protein VFC00_08105 [Micromonosporaceae bacterium]|nr:hypothetical protein [Micromonosporaceae bacterium]